MAEVQVGERDASRIEATADNQTEDLRCGYPKLADLMSKYSQMAIFRRFTSMNMLNILRLQAELQDLERALNETIRNNPCDDFYRMRENLEEQDESDDTRDAEQIELTMKAGEKLKEYNAAVYSAYRLSQIAAPTTEETTFLRSWLNRTDGGNSFLMDAEGTTWDEANEDDFMTLDRRPFTNDTFTRNLKGPLLDLYHRFYGGRKKTNSPFRDYSDRKIRAGSRGVGTVVGSVLPTIAILILYFVQSQLIRIGLVIIFTALFSFALSVFTTATVEGIFTATATFAAVEVVFIGTTSNSTS